VATSDPALERLLEYVREARGFDFTGYKRPSLIRRITKRMQAVGAEDYAAYEELLEAQPDEFPELFDTILINVTGFLRDRDAWAYLAGDVIPQVVGDRPPGSVIRVWSAGCASGEEVYSLAVLLCEAVGESRFRESVKIYGTDADEEALAQARQGRYSGKAVREAFSEEQISRFFEPDDGRNGDSCVFRKDLRRSVIFGRHDLVRDPPISKVDLLLCRNTLMYFNAETQRRILTAFHFALNQGGFLFLGKSEALVTRTNLFVLENTDHHVFSKRGPRQHERPVPTVPTTSAAVRVETRVELLDAAYEASPVAQLVIDRDGRLELANRHARWLFALGLGDVGRAFKDLELSYRPVELRSRIEQVLLDRRPVTVGDVEFELPGGGIEFLEVQILPLGGPDSAGGVSLTFAQVGRHKLLRDELERSQRELETAYEELQSTVEELETTNEELQSTNEELETTNEELHSTNEELETMNEELQSTNEELETINAELRQRTQDLDDSNAFLESILTSLGSGVAVLDRQMAVRIWNRQAEDLWGLRAEEVQGHHFLNLDIGLPVDDLRQQIRAAANGQTEQARVVLTAVNRRGRTIECAVTITPLLGADRSSEGVIIRMDHADGMAERR
jgi:two-component system CheB/CheR fusion protein